MAANDLNIDDLLRFMVEQKASDLHIKHVLEHWGLRGNYTIKLVETKETPSPNTHTPH